MIKITRYYEPENSDYAGNPLVTVFPPLTPQKLATLMTSPIKFDPARRQHADHLRVQYILGIQEYFKPQDHQRDWAWGLLSLVFESLKGRNPMKGSDTDAFNEMCASIVSGEPSTNPFPTFIESKWCSTLFGTPGTGKSATAKAVLTRLGPSLFHHVVHGQLFQKFAVCVQTPKKATGKALAQKIFAALRDTALEAGHFIPFQGRIPSTETELLLAIEVLVKKLNLGVLVIEELQHLFRGAGLMDDDAMRLLTGLVNQLEVPLLLIGTWECLPLLGLEGRLGRRAASPASGIFCKMANDKKWFQFLSELFELQYLRHPVKLTQEIADAFYKHTQGIQDLAVKLFVMSQIAVLQLESEEANEELTLAVIEATAKNHMRVVAPWIRHMQRGSSEDDIVIYDAEPVDFEKYVKSFNARAVLRSRRTVAGKRRTALEGSASALQVAEALVASGVPDADAALALANDAVEEASHKTVAELVEKVLSESRTKGPSPTKSAKPAKRKAVYQQFSALEDDDLRKIVFLALENGQSAVAGLQDAGYICDALVDIPF